MRSDRRTPFDTFRRAPGAANERGGDGYRRETFTLPLDAARAKAREFLDRFPKAAYMTEVEHWRQLDDGQIEFTMRRLPTAD